MRGKASRDPKLLCPCIRALCRSLLDMFYKQTGEQLVIIETLRDEERQRYYYDVGASRTMRSKHLPQPPNDLALAFDVCPAPYLRLKAWCPHGSLWSIAGELGVELGLVWGGDWRTFRDQPHFQVGACECRGGK